MGASPANDTKPRRTEGGFFSAEISDVLPSTCKYWGHCCICRWSYAMLLGKEKTFLQLAWVRGSKVFS